MRPYAHEQKRSILMKDYNIPVGRATDVAQYLSAEQLQTFLKRMGSFLDSSKLQDVIINGKFLLYKISGRLDEYMNEAQRVASQNGESSSAWFYSFESMREAEKNIKREKRAERRKMERFQEDSYETMLEKYGISSKTTEILRQTMSQEEFSEYSSRLEKALKSKDAVRELIERTATMYYPPVRRQEYLRAAEQLSAQLETESLDVEKFLTLDMVKYQLVSRKEDKKKPHRKETSSRKKLPKKEPTNIQKLFFKETTTEVLTREEEIALAYRIQQGDREAVWELVMPNIGLVRKIAFGYVKRLGPRVDVMDLIAVGVYGEPKTYEEDMGKQGLKRAAENFSPDFDCRFSTYAVWAIRQAMSKYLRQPRVIRVPVYHTDLLNRIEKAEARLTELTGERPTSEEVAREMGEVYFGKTLRYLRSDEVEKSQRIGAELYNMNKAQDIDKEGELDHNQEVPIDDDPIEFIADVEKHNVVAELLEKLQDRSALVLKERFGLDTERYDDNHTLQEVGKKLGLTRERARQIEKKGLKDLRTLGETDPDLWKKLHQMGYIK